MPIGKKITLYWDCFNGYSDEFDYEAYDYVVYIKHGSPFLNTDISDAEIRIKQRAEAVSSFEGKFGEAEYYVSSADYLNEDEDDNKLEDFQTYKLDYYASNAGKYYFVIWAKKNGKYHGPTYYPNVYKNGVAGVYEPADPSEDGSEQKPLVISEDAGFNLTDQVRIYGFTYSPEGDLGPTGIGGTPASKSLGGGVSSLEIKDDSSPTFTYTTAFDNKIALENIYFDAKSRVTIRKQNKNSNTPSKDIYFEITGANLLENYTSFPVKMNSPEIASCLKNEDGTTKDYQITNSGFAITNLVNEDSLPIRNFDIVVEAYTNSTLKTSAGNKIHDGIVNKSEGDFPEGSRYDILEVNLVPPSGLIFLDEYSERDGYVTPQQGYDKSIPYILEPKINDRGDLQITILESVDSTPDIPKKFASSAEIRDQYFKGIKGGVIYYADQPFTLNPEEIELAGDNNSENQFVTVKGEGGTTKIRAKRDFFLSTDVRRISTDSLTISFSAFKDQSLTETNVIVGFFDDLLYRKHFQTAGTPKIKLENGVAGETILSEKNLSFSKTISPLSQITSFDPGVHLSNQPSSISLFKKSPVDEGAKALSYRCYVYFSVAADGEVKDLGSKGISSIESNAIKPKPYIFKGSEVTIRLKETKSYVPVVNFYEEEEADLVISPTSNTVKLAKPKNDSGYSEAKLSVTNSETVKSCRIFVGFLSPS